MRHVFKKQGIKRFTSVVAAVMMAVTCMGGVGSTAVSADTTNTGSITIENPAEGHDYTIYQIMTGTYSDGDTLSDAKWGADVVATYTAGDAVTDVQMKTFTDLANNAQATADTVAAYVSSTAQGQGTLSTTTKKVGNLTSGYYIVFDTYNKDATEVQKKSPISTYIVKVVGGSNVDIEPKIGTPTLEKKVQDKNDSTQASVGESDWGDDADHDIGDSVPYKLTGTLPANLADYSTYTTYTFTDIQSKGLTLLDESNQEVTVSGSDATSVTSGFKVTYYKDNTDTNGTDITELFDAKYENYTATSDDKADYDGGHKFTVSLKDGIDLRKSYKTTISNDVVIASTDVAEASDSKVTFEYNEAAKIVLTYDAKLNSDAKRNYEGNPNKAYLTYSNNPNAGHSGDTAKTPDSTAIVFTYDLVVSKTDNKENPLAGAEFTLQKVQDGSNKGSVDSSKATAYANGAAAAVAPTYKVTTDSEAKSGKTYYTKSTTTTYTQVQLPNSDDIGSYYEKDATSGAYSKASSDFDSEKTYYTATTSSEDVGTTYTVADTSSGVTGLYELSYTLTFKGLDDGVYVLSETKTPTSYNTMADVVFTVTATHSDEKLQTITITENSDTSNATAFTTPTYHNATDNKDYNTGEIDAVITNYPGSSLPSTGGAGRFIYVGFGAAGLALVVALLTLKKKKRA